MTNQVPSKGPVDFWLCAAAGLYVFNLIGWASYLIWRIWHG